MLDARREQRPAADNKQNGGIGSCTRWSLKKVWGSVQPIETFKGTLDAQEKYAIQKNHNKGDAKKKEEIDKDASILDEREIC